MCVIIVHQDGKWILQKKDYHTAFENNPDGYGVMWAEDGKVMVRRGMEWDGFKKVMMQITGKPHVTHFRWATHGDAQKKNCHPFQVTEDVWMMHNGIIDIPIWEENRSDSYHFAKYVVGPFLKAYPHLYGTAKFDEWVRTMAGRGNKFAFIRSDGKMQIVNERAGTWINEGIWTSNLGSFYARPRERAVIQTTVVGGTADMAPSRPALPPAPPTQGQKLLADMKKSKQRELYEHVFKYTRKGWKKDKGR